MSLSDLAALGSFVSGFAVLVSLVYLTFQVRQAERAIRGGARQYRATYGSGILFATMEPATQQSMFKVFVNSPDVTLFDVQRVTALVTAMLNGWRVIYLNVCEGLDDKEEMHWLRATIPSVLATPFGRVIWTRLRDRYPARFQEFVDGLLRSERPRGAPQTIEEWRAEVAEQMRQ